MILVVDNSLDVCAVVSGMVRAMGHTCDTALSGEQAIEMAARVAYETIFVDIGMHGMDGIEAGKRLREMQPAARIVAYTGDQRVSTAMLVKQAGFDGLLIKPASFEEMRALLP